MDDDPTRMPHADLWWIPVGAGSRVVPVTSGLWERLHAVVERRRPMPLFHAALEVHGARTRHVVEMAPAWSLPASRPRGVVATGPVGLRVLGVSRLFRYEIRCWEDGVLPDRAWAVGGPRRIPLTDASARALVRRIGSAPLHTWGRRPPGSRDMWNSNSLIAWALASEGIDLAPLGPPAGGRAPGWEAGIAETGVAAVAGRGPVGDNGGVQQKNRPCLGPYQVVGEDVPDERRRRWPHHGRAE